MTTPILLFAAGLGTRMGDLVKDRPKPLIHVAGKALIDHALDLTMIPEVGQRVVNVHYKADMLRSHLAQRLVQISDESEELLETGGGLKKALPLLGESPVLTLNTDAVWRGPNPIETILKGWRPEMEALLLLVPKPQVHGHRGAGDFTMDENGRLVRAPDAVYPGLQMLRADGLEAIQDKAFSMNVLWDQIARRGGLYGVNYAGQWCDVGQPSSIPIAESMLHV